MRKKLNEGPVNPPYPALKGSGEFTEQPVNPPYPALKSRNEIKEQPVNPPKQDDAPTPPPADAPGPDWQKIGQETIDKIKAAGKTIKKVGSDIWAKIQDVIDVDPDNAKPLPKPADPKDAITNPGFPKCVSTISGVYYTQSKQASVKGDNGVKYLFNLDNTYSGDDGETGTWKCISDTEVEISTTKTKSSDGNTNGGGNNNQVASGKYPYCVLGLGKKGDYFYSTATDANGNTYYLYFTSESKKSTDGTEGNRVMIVDSSGKQSNGVYVCAGDQIQVVSWDGGYTLTVKVASSSQDTQSYLDSIVKFNTGGLEVLFGESNTLNRQVIDSVNEKLLGYMDDNYRGPYFRQFFDMLVNLRKLCETQNKTKDASYLQGIITDFKTKVSEKKANVNASNAQLKWSVTTKPDDKDLNLYEDYNISQNIGATKDVFLWRYQGDLTTTKAIENTDKNLSVALGESGFNEESCVKNLTLLIQTAGKSDLIKGLPRVAQTTKFNTDRLKGIKQVIVACSRAKLYNLKKYNKALNYLSNPEDPLYTVEPRANCSNGQPPNPKPCEAK